MNQEKHDGHLTKVMLPVYGPHLSQWLSCVLFNFIVVKAAIIIILMSTMNEMIMCMWEVAVRDKPTNYYPQLHSCPLHCGAFKASFISLSPFLNHWTYSGHKHDSVWIPIMLCAYPTTLTLKLTSCQCSKLLSYSKWPKKINPYRPWSATKLNLERPVQVYSAIFY